MNILIINLLPFADASSGMEERKRNEEPEAADSARGDEYDYSSAHRKTNNSRMDVNNNEAPERRKAKVLDLDSKGYTQDEIAEELGISQPTVSRDLKEAHDSIAKSRTDYVRQAFRDHERTKLGQNKALKGLWSIAEDSATPPSDKLRAYSLIIQCNTRKNQATTIARALSQWMDLELKAQEAKESASLTFEERLERSYGRDLPRKEAESDPDRDVSDFMSRI